MKLAGAVRCEPQGFDHIVRHLLVRVRDSAERHLQAAWVAAVQLLREVAHRPVSAVAHPGQDEPHGLIDRGDGLSKRP